MKTHPWLLAAGLLTTSFTPVHGQVQFLTQPPEPIPSGAAAVLAGHRDRFREQLGISSGADLVSDSYLWRMEEGDLYEVQLTAGPGGVAILGVCDDACGDLDLSLLTISRDLLDEDREMDAFPLAQFVSTQEGTYRLWVRMPNCTNSPCSFELLAVGLGGGTVAKGTPPSPTPPPSSPPAARPAAATPPPSVATPPPSVATPPPSAPSPSPGGSGATTSQRFIGGAFDQGSGTVRAYPFGEGSLAAFISNGDHILYRGVVLGGGARAIRASVASPAAGGTIEVHIGSPNGSLAGSLSVPSTGSWEIFTTLEANLSGASGTQDLYLRFVGGDGYLLNLEWFEFASGDGATEPQGSRGSGATTSQRFIGGGFDAGSGSVRAYPYGDGSLAAFISTGDYILYRGVALGGGAAAFRASVSSAAAGGTIEIHLGSPTGPLAGSLSVPSTQSWDVFTTLEVPLSGASGTQDVYLRFIGGSGYLLNLAWFEFVSRE